MNLNKLIELANHSGGTLYFMALLLLVALTVIIERSAHLSSMFHRGSELMDLLQQQLEFKTLQAKLQLPQYAHLPHTRVIQVAGLQQSQESTELLSRRIEESVMHEVPQLDRSLWMLDTAITLAPWVGLFGTIIGMFHAFSVLDDVQNGASQITGGIAEALIATACGLFIAMLGLIFFNWLNTRVRLIVHQLETIKVMLLNRRY